MKILLVTLQYSYGIPDRGTDTISEFGFRQSFESLGHVVLPFYYDPYLNDPAPLQDALLSAARRAKPELIFFLTYKDHFYPKTLDILNSEFTTVAWFGDDTWRFPSYTSRYAKHYTYSVTTDKFSALRYTSAGQPKVILSQWAAIPIPDPPSELAECTFDVSFVGRHTPERAWFIDCLRQRGISVHAFGYGWEAGPVPLRQMYEIFASSRINLNLSNSTCYDLRYAFFRRKRLLRRIKDRLLLILSPRHFVRALATPKWMSQIKARNFEIPYAGGFQLTEYAPALEDHFDIGKEIVCFRDVDDAAILIDYYLAQSEQRKAIRLRGYHRAQKDHTYPRRLEHILRHISCPM